MGFPQSYLLVTLYPMDREATIFVANQLEKIGTKVSVEVFE
jgi:hypothetical protein